ncbi:unnamed protein product [Musa hybrid cultivar]
MDYHIHESSDNKKRPLDEEFEEQQLEDRVKRNKSPQLPDTPDIKDMQLLLDNSYHRGREHGDSSIVSQLGGELIVSCLLRLSRSDYGAVASLNRMFRSLIRSGELYQLRRKMDIVEHWVYFSCSVLEWEAYDPYRGRWITVPKMPPTESFMCSDKESLAVGTELLVFGKEVNSHIILRYSILTNSWSRGVVMNSPRCLFGSASLGEKAIVAGGTNAQGDILNSAELYNSQTQTWETLPSMNQARKMCSGVFMDEKFYVIGGMASNTKVLTCGEEYDLKRGSWSVIPNMSDGLNGANGAPPLVAVVNNELYAAHYADKELRKYDKVKHTWVRLGSLPESSVSMNGWGLAFRACGERLIVIGGRRGSLGGMIELNSWIPNRGPPEWNMIASKHSGNFVYNCAMLLNMGESLLAFRRPREEPRLGGEPPVQALQLLNCVRHQLTSIESYHNYYPYHSTSNIANSAVVQDSQSSSGQQICNKKQLKHRMRTTTAHFNLHYTWQYCSFQFSHLKPHELVRQQKSSRAILTLECLNDSVVPWVGKVLQQVLEWPFATLLPFASSFSLASSVGAKLRGVADLIGRQAVVLEDGVLVDASRVLDVLPPPDLHVVEEDELDDEEGGGGREVLGLAGVVPLRRVDDADLGEDLRQQHPRYPQHGPAPVHELRLHVPPEVLGVLRQPQRVESIVGRRSEAREPFAFLGFHLEGPVG